MLEMSDNPKQPALCYSKNKRKILEEKETTQSPGLPDSSLVSDHRQLFWHQIFDIT